MIALGALVEEGDLLPLHADQAPVAEVGQRQVLGTAGHDELDPSPAGTGTPEEARQQLDEVCSWFSEGFDTPDLVDAKALLDRLA